MNKFLLTTIFIGFCSILNAQNRNETIDIIETSHKSVVPDILVLDYDITVVQKSEKEAISILAKQMDEQIANLISVGFDKDKLKLSDFNLSEKNDWEDGKSKNLGFEAKQSIKVKIPISEKEIIGKLIESLSLKKISNVYVSVSSELSEDLENKTRLELISLAINKAKTKAGSIANSLDSKLGKIKTVEYGDLMQRQLERTVRFVPPRLEINKNRTEMDSSPWGMLGASETDLYEKIHIIWTIE